VGKKTLAKIAGSLSPLAGIATGRGAYGTLAGLGALGPAAALVAPKHKKKKKGAAGLPDETGGPHMNYRKGGKVKHRKGDGCCKQGYTKGKMR
jgi:hypothetical protein